MRRNPTMPRIRTVEGSCWACKERRVICDLGQPSCAKCINTGRSCDYGKVRLRWTDCVASRGRLAGQKIPLSRNPPIRKNTDHHLLYFQNEILPRFNMTNTVPRFDLQILAREPVLLQSVVAMGAAHESYRHSCQTPESSLTKSEDRKHAIRMFRKHLMMMSHTETTNNSLFYANVLLCMLDGIIEQQGKEDAASHLHIVGGKAILNHWGGVPSILETKPELPIMMLSIFSTMDLTHALLTGENPFLDAPLWAAFGDSEPWWGNVKPNDDFLETMAVFSQLATLGHEVRHTKSIIPIGILLSVQMALEQQASRRADDENQKQATTSWVSFCTVWRYAASIYLYRALSGLSVGHHLIQQAVTGVLDIVASTLLTDNLHHCILFPLLIVGSHCLKNEQRCEIRRRISNTAAFLSFGSLRTYEQFFELVWSRLDHDPLYLETSWWDYFGEIAHLTCLF